jgi:hypothetical protein
MGTSIVVYGSLINPVELERQGLGELNPTPVKVHGFKRIFNQKPSWRKGEGNASAVLNIEQTSNSWFNAVILHQQASWQYDALKQREQGYNVLVVPWDIIEPYKGELADSAAYMTYIGKKKLNDNSLAPNPLYLETCLVGADFWGSEFYRDFLATTFLPDGTVLKDMV